MKYFLKNVCAISYANSMFTEVKKKVFLEHV